MTEVIPRLFIGNWHEARDARDTYVVTCAVDSPFIGSGFFPLIDGPGNNPEILVSAIESVRMLYLKEFETPWDKVLVHCVGGRSRSATVVVGAVSRITGKPLCEVYDSLINKHDITRIHPYLSLLLHEVMK